MTQTATFALILLAIVAAVNAVVKMPVTIYYESLCPDSAKFISEKVYPAVKGELKDYVDITWVPFGKSSFSTQGSEINFNCHHGPNECYGNKVHACAIEHIEANSYQTEFTRESLLLDFVSCMMRAGKNFDDNVYPGARCARESRVNSWEIIQQCANSTEGSLLLKKHGDTTNMFQNPLMSVPTVVFKDKNDPKVNERAMKDFLGAACNFISLPQPRICAALNAANSNGVAYGITFMAVLAYTLSKIL